MFCPTCGCQLPDGSDFCAACGNPVPASAQPACQPPCEQQAPYEQPAYEQPYYYQAPVPELPMKWFKFLIYLSLFVAAFSNLVNGIAYITGHIYEMQEQVEAATVYDAFPAMRPVDILFGIYQIAAAAYCLVVRQSLAQFKAIGPKLLIGLYGATACATVLYEVATGIVLAAAGAEFDVTSVIGSCIGSVLGFVVMYFCNKTYFEKRNHLFVN